MSVIQPRDNSLQQLYVNIMQRAIDDLVTLRDEAGDDIQLATGKDQPYADELRLLWADINRQIAALFKRQHQIISDYGVSPIKSQRGDQ